MRLKHARYIASIKLAQERFLTTKKVASTFFIIGAMKRLVASAQTIELRRRN